MILQLLRCRTPDGHTVKNVAVMANRKAFAVSAGRSVTIISVEDAELDESKIKVQQDAFWARASLSAPGSASSQAH